MKKTFSLLSLLLLFACQEEMTPNSIETPHSPNTQTFKLFKESYLNQSSGISFWWYAGWGYDTPVNEQTGYFSQGQAYHDINGDGYMDILTSHGIPSGTQQNVTLSWYINDRTNNTFIKSPQYINGSGFGIESHKIVKTDVNNDALADFIVFGVNELVTPYTGNFIVLIQKKDKTFNIINLGNAWHHNGSVGDLNNDGFVDVITLEYIWWGDGTGNFKKSSIDLKDLGVLEILEYEIIDIDKDGWNDLVLGTAPHKNSTTLILNDKGQFKSTNKKIRLEYFNKSHCYDLEIYDIDTDGDLDIIELRIDESRDFSKLYVHINNNLEFNYIENYIQDSEDGGFINSTIDKHGWRRFKFDDLDNDGRDEIVIENLHDGYNPNNNNLVYNCLKKVDEKWKKSMIGFGK